MSKMRKDVYIANCFNLARSIHIYDIGVAHHTLNYYRENYPDIDVCDEINPIHPYHIHLQGSDMPGIDSPMLIPSIDDPSISVAIDSTLALSHPKTYSELRTNRLYRDRIIEMLSTEHIMVHQRVMGALYPVSNLEQCKDGDILWYDESLVQDNEYSLMHDLQTWIYSIRYRWRNSGYVLTDDLYASAYLGILYLHIVSAIMLIRDKAAFTPQAHLFYVQSFLRDNVGQVDLDALSKSSLYRLYDHMLAIQHTKGNNSSYELINNILASKVWFLVGEYKHIPLLNDDLYGCEVNYMPKNKQDILDATRLGSLYPYLPGVDSTKEVETAWINNAHLDKANVLTIDSRQGFATLWSNIKSSLIEFWGWLSLTDRYTELQVVTLADGRDIDLSAKQAFYLYWYSKHGDKVISLASVPSLGILNSDPELLRVEVPDLVTVDNFITIAEYLYNTRNAHTLPSVMDMAVLSQSHRRWRPQIFFIDVVSEVQALGLSAIHDKATLDRLVEQFTRYTQSDIYKQTKLKESIASIYQSLISYSTEVAIQDRDNVFLAGIPAMIPILEV